MLHGYSKYPYYPHSGRIVCQALNDKFDAMFSIYTFLLSYLMSLYTGLGLYFVRNPKLPGYPDYPGRNLSVELGILPGYIHVTWRLATNCTT